MNWKRFRFVILLAKRDIVDDRKISLIVIAMLSFSFLNLAFFPAFITGLTDTFTSTIIETQTGHVSIQPETGERLENADSLARKVSSLENVREVEKRLESPSTVTYRGKSFTTTAIGTSVLGSETYSSRMQYGSFLTDGDTDKVVLGRTVAQEGEQFGVEGIGVKPGRQVDLRLENGSKKLKVKGTIGRLGASSLQRQIVLPYETAEDMLDAEDQASSVKILLDDRDQADEFASRLKKLNTRGEIKTWQDVSQAATSFTNTFSIVTAVVSVVGLVVAVTSIGVVIFINTNKRARETGIVRSIGAERLEILEVFLLEALVFGAIGILIGNAIMLSIHYFLASNPISTPLGPLTTVVTPNLLITRSLWMLGAAVVAGLIPAYLVSQRNIIDTIEQR